MKKKLILIFLAFTVLGFAQSPNQNYIKTRTYRYPSTIRIASDDTITSIDYADGLGKALQIVNVRAGGNKQDIIIPQVYDNLGRVAKTYLPYANPAQTVSSPNYRDNTNLINTLTTYYQNNYPGELSATTPNPYAEIFFEASPLNRVSEQAAPGQSWRGIVGSDADHTVKHAYDSNYVTLSSAEVQSFAVKFTDVNDLEKPSLSAIGYLSRLFKTVTKDENWTTADVKNKTTEEFKDKSGRTILKRSYNSGQFHDTYYVYDKFSNLTYVIPPLASDQVAYADLPAFAAAGINYAWVTLGKVDQKLADDYQRELDQYENEDILSLDLLDKYGGQGGFSVVVNDDGEVSLNLNITTIEPLELRTGEVVDLKQSGNFTDRELGKISGKDFEYYFLIKNSMLYIDGYGKIPSSYLNTTLTGKTPLEYSKNYPWTKVAAKIDPEIVQRYEEEIEKLDNSEILTTYIDNPYNARGGLFVNVDKDDTVTVSFNINSATSMELQNGSVFTLDTQRRVEDRDLGVIEGEGYRYEFSIRENSLYVIGSGLFKTFSFNISRRGPFARYKIRQEVVEGLCYIYNYDFRNRVVEKKIPGKGWEYIVYDKLDRPVLTQDQNLKALGKWLFTKYDIYGRVLYTGEYISSSDRKTLQNQVNLIVDPSEKKATTSFYNSGVNVHYTKDVFPNTNINLFTVNYYDDYVFDKAGITVPTQNSYGVLLTSGLKGLNTGSKIRILGSEDWVTNMIGYDDKARVIWNYNKNLFGSDNVVNNSFDFIGNITASTILHKRIGFPDLTIYDTYAYDIMGRLTEHRQSQTPQSGSNAGPYANVIAQNTYDELGQLIGKGVGGRASRSASFTPLQQISYDYNIRGWLTDINDVNADFNLPSMTKLFAFKINYQSNLLPGTTLLYNGNISETHWKTKSDKKIRSYSYAYDALNRLNKATTYDYNYTLLGTTQKENYTEGPINYDKNGNIISLSRDGLKLGATSAQNTITKIDMLGYVYTNYSNRLRKVNDAALTTEGFIDGNVDGVNVPDDFDYDANGNLKLDRNKKIASIAYNHLNLPTDIVFDNGDKLIYNYDAVGNRVYKGVKRYNLSTMQNVVEYIGGFVYERSLSNSPAVLKFFQHPEGYVNVPVVVNNAYSPDNFEYIYQYKDHLGNVRLTYKDNGTSTPEIIEEDNYYPFGLKHKGYNNNVTFTGLAQKYKYSGKELQDELQLNLYDFGARNYDATLGKWMSIDPLAESRYWLSPYNYAQNNPIYYIDPDGKLDKEWDHDIITGKQTLVSDKGGDTTDYINIKANGKYLYTEVEQVKHKSITIESNYPASTGTSVIRVPGFVNTFSTVYRPSGGAIDQMDFSSPFFPMGAIMGNIFNVLGKVGSGIDPFLFGSITFKTPINIPVQRFGQMSFSKTDYWGLRLGTNKFLNRTFVAIKPEWNTLTQYTKGVIPKGTPIRVGIAGPQGLKYPGGSMQFLVNSGEVMNQTTTIVP